MSDETTPVTPAPAPAPRAQKQVLLKTAHGHVFQSVGNPDIVHSGTVVTADAADEIRTAARKMGIRITAKDA